MRSVTLASALAATLALAACQQDTACTPEALDQKTTDLMVAVQAFGAANPDRMTEVGPKVADLVVRAGDATGDLAPLCDEVEALMKEIGG